MGVGLTANDFQLKLVVGHQACYNNIARGFSSVIIFRCRAIIGNERATHRFFCAPAGNIGAKGIDQGHYFVGAVKNIDVIAGQFIVSIEHAVAMFLTIVAVVFGQRLICGDIGLAYKLVLGVIGSYSYDIRQAIATREDGRRYWTGGI